MELLKRRWYHLSLRKALVLYVAAAVLAPALCALTAKFCGLMVREIYLAYPERAEKYYLTKEEWDSMNENKR